MYSDDEEVAFGGGRGRSHGRSPSPPHRRDHRGGRSGRSRSRGRGGDEGGRSRFGGGSPKRGGGGRDAVGREAGGKDKGKGARAPRTTGREIPPLNSIHKGTVARVQSFGAFVRLGDGATYKDGLLHISRLSATGRVEQVEDVVAESDIVWVKVVEVREEEGKYSLDMRFVGQKDGEDKDPHNTQADIGGKGKGKGGPEPIRIGAVQATTCSRCGAKGHMARECFASSGQQFGLLEELPAERRPNAREEAGGCERPDSAAPGHDPKVVKAALKAYLRRKAPGAESSSSSSSSSSSKKKKKAKKKEKKRKKKEKKKEKKEKKKMKKKLKEGAKADAKAKASATNTAGSQGSSSSAS